MIKVLAETSGVDRLRRIEPSPRTPAKVS